MILVFNINPPTLQRSSVWEQLQITSFLVSRGFGSPRARGSCQERIIPNMCNFSSNILPDLARSWLAVFRVWGLWAGFGSARGRPKRSGSHLDAAKKSSKNRPLKKSTFWAILMIFGIFSTNFWPFWVHFGVPRREKVKIVILWKSC